MGLRKRNGDQGKVGRVGGWPTGRHHRGRARCGGRWPTCALTSGRGGRHRAALPVSAANLVTRSSSGAPSTTGSDRGDWTSSSSWSGGLVGLRWRGACSRSCRVTWPRGLSEGVAYDLRDALFERIERLSFSYYDRVRRASSSPASPATWSRSAVSRLRCRAASQRRRDARRRDSLLLYLDWQLALVALAIVPVIALLLARFVGRIRPSSGRSSRRSGV